MQASELTLLCCERVYDGLTGRRFVRIVVCTAKGPKLSEYRYRTVAHGVVELETEGGEVYTVTRHGCTCGDARYRRRIQGCKHRTALSLLKMLGNNQLHISGGTT
jgi:hypothetical protein